MAQITGFMCDICDAFSVKRDGWMKVTPYAETTNAGIDVCSNKCLIKLGRQRAEGSGETHAESRRSYSKYGDDIKLEVLTYAEQHTIKEASDKFGVGISTIKYWKGQIAS